MTTRGLRGLCRRNLTLAPLGSNPIPTPNSSPNLNPSLTLIGSHLSRQEILGKYPDLRSEPADLFLVEQQTRVPTVSPGLLGALAGAVQILSPAGFRDQSPVSVEAEQDLARLAREP